MLIRRIINSSLLSNTYMLSEHGNHNVALIDIGDLGPILRMLKSEDVISKVFLTHIHYDHIYGLPDLLAIFPNCEVFTSDFGKEALRSAKLNLSKYHNDPIICEPKKLKVLSDGDTVELFNSHIQTIATPGHNKSCLSYLIDDNIFTGDSFIPRHKVIESMPNSDRNDARKYELFLSKLSMGKNLFPGHGIPYLPFENCLE